MKAFKYIKLSGVVVLICLFSVIFVYQNEVFSNDTDNKSKNSSSVASVNGQNNSQGYTKKEVDDILESIDLKDNSSDTKEDTYFSVYPKSLNAGDILVLSVFNLPKGEEIKVESDFNFNPEFYDVDDKKVALLPVSYNLKPGVHTITLTANKQKKAYKITVKDKDWDVQNLYINSSLSTDDTSIKEYNDVIIPLREVSDAKKHWKGEFIEPCKGEITTTFGTIRYTNNSKKANRHDGIDIAAPTDTIVKASNAGRVIYAGFLQQTGNTVIIEHGLGVKTYYYHMNSLNVNLDQMVKKGATVGKVGTTGYSTGPHLHFSMSVNKIIVYPYTKIKMD